MKTTVSLLVGSFWVIMIMMAGCTQQSSPKSSNQELGTEIVNVGDVLPPGWNFTIITQNLEEIPRPHGLWNPVAVVNFTNPSLSFKGAGGEHQHLSLWLYFYNISEKHEIMGIIANESIYSWCIPIYFNETHQYIIVTSPCCINGGVFTEETQQYYIVLEKSLKKYFHEFT